MKTHPVLATLDTLGDPKRRPVVTGVVFAVTAATSIAQLVDHPLLGRFQRDPAIAHGEWWRLVTASFFQDGWLLGTIFNLFILAVVGLRAERVFGHWRWPVLYFAAALFGNVMSYLWLQPVGAGNSMAVAGLVGALATAVLCSQAPNRFAALAVPALAVVDTALGDNHGLPALFGMALGWLLLGRGRRGAAHLGR
ncbi:rhomboid family intramembrane serine protease [Amycolatopsis acidiphila]|uniref:Rhomboid family intramembrane serine protease n=1 Tax=Amycolatopsis acidiphila TaxID=715473 RepID=A0A557ZYF7_9PSEU|nr:rhomboid family intramembrane serine protease [Amycolatopsis acidiphila]TVT17046.1 rhomboid family intramembrane serine protease [Amycolatopsis acidiphila]UIJ60765.1 rhomboid family intramembrane serine protease [Amycolatopsis acidiphila]